MKKQVVIVGGGFSGIISLKICLENGLDAYCYERLEEYGGLWRFREHVDIDGVPSVTKNTIIDTSKEVGAFSDFPPPDDFPNYMHNSKMIEYLGLYIKANNLQPRIRYQHDILKIDKSPTYTADGGWDVLVKNKVTEEENKVEAQAVFVCTGHHAFPNYQRFEGQEDFEGTVIHSHSFKSPSRFEGQRVVVVGVGNSAMDAAAELSFLSKQVYLSTRRGAWILPRMGPNGLPIDFGFSRSKQYFYDYFPNKWRDETEKYLNSQFDHEKYGLKPKHRCDQQHPSISDIVPPRILAGAIQVKDDILRLTKNGVIFKNDENTEVPIDAIVACTGYCIRIPFLPKEEDLPEAPTKNDVGLYGRIFPVHLPHPTLAFIGMVQPIGPLFPLMELQARWACRLINEMGKSARQLAACGWPATPSERAKEVAKFQMSIAKRFVHSPRHTIEVDYVTYTDYLAEQVGCKPNLFTLAFTDTALWCKLMFGPQLPYQFRLKGPHSWSKARETVMNAEKRVDKGFKKRGGSSSGAVSTRGGGLAFSFVVVACVAVVTAICYYVF